MARLLKRQVLHAQFRLSKNSNEWIRAVLRWQRFIIIPFITLAYSNVSVDKTSPIRHH